MNLNDFPRWILWNIAQESPNVYHTLILSSRKLGLWSLTNQETIQNHFTIKINVPPKGHIKYVLCGKKHKFSGPAVEKVGGTKKWYRHGELHRKDGPAIIYKFRESSNFVSREWYLNGKRHREDGPAIEHMFGGKEWFLNGLPHRIGGPAVDVISIGKVWCVNGKRHREDGPAVEESNGSKAWYLNGLLHRTDGPAIEEANGNKVRYLNGLLHKINVEEGNSI